MSFDVEPLFQSLRIREVGTGPCPDSPSMRPSGLWGPGDRWTSLDAAYIERMRVPTRPMSDSDIQDVIDAYARGARHPQKLRRGDELPAFDEARLEELH